MLEDYELELKLMHKYGVINNLGDTLIYYRIHSDQITYNKDLETAEITEKRNQIVDEIINPRPTEQEMDCFDDW